MNVPCSVAGCSRPSRARGVCAMHYARDYYYEPHEAARRKSYLQRPDVKAKRNASAKAFNNTTKQKIRMRETMRAIYNDAYGARRVRGMCIKDMRECKLPQPCEFCGLQSRILRALGGGFYGGHV